MARFRKNELEMIGHAVENVATREADLFALLIDQVAIFTIQKVKDERHQRTALIHLYAALTIIDTYKEP